MAKQTEQVTPGTDPSPFASKWWILSIGLLLGLVLMVVVVFAVLRPWEPDAASQAGAPPGAAPQGGPAEPPAGWEPCSQVDTPNPAPALETAPATEWVEQDGVLLPKTAGGWHAYNAPIAECYTPDTVGALTAAYNIAVRLNIPGGRDVADKQVSKEINTASVTNEGRGMGGRITGFKTDKIDGNTTTVWLHFIRHDKAVDIGIPYGMEWTGTDWKMVPPPARNASYDVREGLDDYIPWEP